MAINSRIALVTGAIKGIGLAGTLAVTQSLLPLLRTAPAARIVNLSSSLGSLAGNGARPHRTMRRSTSATTPPRRR